MSIISGIVDGFQSVLGLKDDKRDTKEALDYGLPKEPKRSSTPAAKQRTTFEPATTGVQSRTGGLPLFLGNSAPQRPFGLGAGSVSTDELLRNALAESLRSMGSTTQPAGQPAMGGAAVQIFDSSRPQANGSASLIGDGRSVQVNGPANARTAASNVQLGLDYYRRTFGRNGLDNRGGNVQVVLNDQSKGTDGTTIFRGNGGFYVSHDANGRAQPALRFGSGTQYQHARGGLVDQKEMSEAPDLMVHEMTHGLIYHETGATGGTSDESGSVNEALADVMAASATRDWRIGERMYSASSAYRELRDISNPQSATAVHPLWTSMSEYRAAQQAGKVEEHYASGILSTAGYRMQQKMGWESVEKLFYNTITGGKLGGMSFQEAANALRSSASQLWGNGSQQQQVVDSELRAAGL